METTMHDQGNDRRRTPTRTCVGCGTRDDAVAMLRLVVADAEVAFDLAGGAFGRGAHLHARPECLEKAPRGLARAFRRESQMDAPELGRRLVEACERRMAGLLLAARRLNALAIGADAATSALRGGAPLAIVAVDAGSVADDAEVGRAVAGGRAVAWRTKAELGGLLGDRLVAICAVRHEAIAAELKRMRAAAGAGAAVAREGAGCSRCSEAR